MNKLRSTATQIVPLQLRVNLHKVMIDQLKIRFPLAENKTQIRRERSRLIKQHRSKPLVLADDKPTFGELAVLRCLNSDDWEGVWVDDYCRCFRDEMPYADAKTAALPPHAKKM